MLVPGRRSGAVGQILVDVRVWGMRAHVGNAGDIPPRGSSQLSGIQTHMKTRMRCKEETGRKVGSSWNAWTGQGRR